MNLRNRVTARAFDALARWLIRRAARTPYTHLVQADGRPYMDRFWLFRLGKPRPKIDEPGTYYPLFGRIHHIQSSDDDRAFHDHPGTFWTLILRGGYTEIRPLALLTYDAVESNDAIYFQPWLNTLPGEAGLVSHKRYSAGQLLRRKVGDLHMLHLDEGQTAVTLFIGWRWARRWGFLQRGRIVPWQTFDREHGGGVRSVDPGQGAMS